MDGTDWVCDWTEKKTVKVENSTDCVAWNRQTGLPYPYTSGGRVGVVCGGGRLGKKKVKKYISTDSVAWSLWMSKLPYGTLVRWDGLFLRTSMKFYDILGLQTFGWSFSLVYS